MHDDQLQLVAPTTHLQATHTQIQALQQRMFGLALCLVIIVVFSTYGIAASTHREHSTLLLLARQSGWKRRETALASASMACTAALTGVLLGLLWG